MNVTSLNRSILLQIWLCVTETGVESEKANVYLCGRFCICCLLLRLSNNFLITDNFMSLLNNAVRSSSCLWVKMEGESTVRGFFPPIWCLVPFPALCKPCPQRIKRKINLAKLLKVFCHRIFASSVCRMGVSDLHLRYKRKHQCLTLFYLITQNYTLRKEEYKPPKS